MTLSEHSKKLYRLSAKLNLYISIAGENSIDANRIKKEITQIITTANEIENLIFFDKK